MRTTCNASLGLLYLSTYRVSHSDGGVCGEGGLGACSLHPIIFLKPSPSKPMPPIPHPPNLKMKPITLKSETPFKEMIPRKKPKKSETVINT